MIAPTRRTLARPAMVEGRGLFTAADTSCVIEPAEPGAGLAFEVADRAGPARVPAAVAFVRDDRPPHPAFAAMPPRCTTLALDESPAIHTTEHVLAALAGLGVTDALIRLTRAGQPADAAGLEPPIGDGSARHVVDALLAAGLRDLDPPAPEPLVITEPVEFADADATIAFAPPADPDAPVYRYRLDYAKFDRGAGPPIPAQSASWTLGDADAFAAEIAPARTFCLAEEAQAMQALGLFGGLTPRDLLVIGPEGPVDNAYRADNECARHKLLDLLGDLALLGRPLLADVTAARTGHAHTHRAARALAGL